MSHGMLEQLSNICLDNWMHSLMRLMQMIEQVHLQQVNATKETSAATGIQEQGISPQGPEIISQESLFQGASQVGGNVSRKSPGKFWHGQLGRHENGHGNPKELHSNLPEGHANMLHSNRIAGWVADASQGLVILLNQKVNQGLSRIPELGMGVLQMGRQVRRSSTSFGAALAMES